MKLARRSLRIKSIRVYTFDKHKCVRLLNKGFTYRFISGKYYSLEKIL